MEEDWKKKYEDLLKVKNSIATECWEYQQRLKDLELIRLSAHAFAGKFGTLEHPVEGWYEDEFSDLEIKLSDYVEDWK